MEISQEELLRIKQLLSAKPVDKGKVDTTSEIAVGCEFCTGNCIGSCEATCADLQESLPRPEHEEDEPEYNFYCDGCDNNCDNSCYQSCYEMCSGACQNSCSSRCGATCEFCCEGQCGVTVSSEPEGAIRKRGYDEE